MPRVKKAQASTVPEVVAENSGVESLPEAPAENSSEAKRERGRANITKGKGRGKAPESNASHTGEELVSSLSTKVIAKDEEPIVEERLMRSRGKKPPLIIDDSADKAEAVLNESEQVVVAKKRRDRQKKEVVAQEEVTEDAAPKKGRGKAKKVNAEPHIPENASVLEEQSPEKKKAARPKRNFTNEKSEGLPTEPKIEGEQHDIAPIVSKKSRSKKVGQEVIHDQLPVADLEAETEEKTVAEPDIKKKLEKRGKAATTAARSQVDTKLSEAYIEVRKGRGNSRPDNTAVPTIVKQDESVVSGSDSAENKKVRGRAKKTAAVIPQKNQQDLVKKGVRNTRAVTSQRDNAEDGPSVEITAVGRKNTGRLKNADTVLTNDLDVGETLSSGRNDRKRKEETDSKIAKKSPKQK